MASVSRYDQETEDGRILRTKALKRDKLKRMAKKNDKDNDEKKREEIRAEG